MTMKKRKVTEFDQATEERREHILEEINEYETERDRLKHMLGKIGGRQYNRIDTVINIVFFALLIGLLVVQATFHVMSTLLSIEMGVLLVSLKIIWMIQAQERVNHFQFWVLNSIEFRVNDIDKRIRRIERAVTPAEDGK